MRNIFLPIIIALNITYLYFWVVVVWARLHGHIDKSLVTNEDITKALKRANFAKDPYLFTIQITTKGGSVPVVRRGIEHALLAVGAYPALKALLKIEVITESQDDIDQLNALFSNTVIPVTLFKLPADYETENNTRLKARALHYMVEQHRLNPSDAYIVHYDEESVFTSDNLARLAVKLLNDPIGISEGTISYALDWSESHVMCRTMESNRPFGCHECYLMMTNPAPLHLHGSNLVIQERLENEIGWDIGQYDNNPLIAEDLVFGLAAYLKYGKDIFGWHGVEMIEQPPFTLNAAFKQRERWVMGALQGVNHVTDLNGWDDLPLLERLKIQVIIRLRVATYAIGLPVSIISLVSWVWFVATDMVDWAFGLPIHYHFALIAIPGLLMWLGANQIGLHQNLSYTGMNVRQKIIEHLKVLACTPFSGLYDTAGPFVAVVKWSIGKKSVKWVPTPKLISQELVEV